MQERAAIQGPVRAKNAILRAVMTLTVCGRKGIFRSGRFASFTPRPSHPVLSAHTRTPNNAARSHAPLTPGSRVPSNQYGTPPSLHRPASSGRPRSECPTYTRPLNNTARPLPFTGRLRPAGRARGCRGARVLPYFPTHINPLDSPEPSHPRETSPRESPIGAMRTSIRRAGEVVPAASLEVPAFFMVVLRSSRLS